jgi:hypothetical protein
VAVAVQRAAGGWEFVEPDPLEAEPGAQTDEVVGYLVDWIGVQQSVAEEETVFAVHRAEPFQDDTADLM